jgi:hypothetical protein
MLKSKNHVDNTDKPLQFSADELDLIASLLAITSPNSTGKYDAVCNSILKKLSANNASFMGEAFRRVRPHVVIYDKVSLRPAFKLDPAVDLVMIQFED